MYEFDQTVSEISYRSLFDYNYEDSETQNICYASPIPGYQLQSTTEGSKFIIKIRCFSTI